MCWEDRLGTHTAASSAPAARAWPESKATRLRATAKCFASGRPPCAIQAGAPCGGLCLELQGPPMVAEGGGWQRDTARVRAEQAGALGQACAKPGAAGAPQPSCPHLLSHLASGCRGAGPRLQSLGDQGEDQERGCGVARTAPPGSSRLALSPEPRDEGRSALHHRCSQPVPSTGHTGTLAPSCPPGLPVVSLPGRGTQPEPQSPAQGTVVLPHRRLEALQAQGQRLTSPSEGRAAGRRSVPAPGACGSSLWG